MDRIRLYFSPIFQDLLGHNEEAELAQKMRHLYDTLINEEDPERDIIGPFMTKPCKKTYPQYYNVVKNPIDMETINKRIKSKVYKTLEEFSADVNLMFDNCKLYNNPKSVLYKDACNLQEIFMKVRNRIYNFDFLSTIFEMLYIL